MAKSVQIGGLWVNKTKKGDRYLAGKLKVEDILAAIDIEEETVLKIAVFENTWKKEGDNKPEYNVLLSPPDEEDKPKKKKFVKKEEVEEDEEVEEAGDEEDEEEAEEKPTKKKKFTGKKSIFGD